MHKPEIKITPRDYQVAGIDAVASAYKRGRRRVLVVLPTGTGKTVLFACLLARKAGRTLVLAHRDELIQQAAAKIKMVLPSAEIGVVAAERNEWDRQIVVASVQTICRPDRLAPLQARNIETIVIDEAHHATADSYRAILAGLGAFGPQAPLTLGVTATPDRTDGVALDSVFEEIVYSRQIADFMPHVRPDGLCDVVTLQINCKDLDLDTVKRAKGDFRETDLAAKMAEADVIPLIFRGWRQHGRDRKTIAFLPSVALAHELAEYAQSEGIRAAAIDGAMDHDKRRRILREYADDEIQLLTNCQIATEGFDEPSISCVLMARPTQSRSLYTQIVGRGLRPYPGKTNCLVLDVVGVSAKHSLCSVADLFGLHKAELKSKSVSAALVAKEAEKERLQGLPDQGNLKLYQGATKPVDAMQKLAWVRSHAGLFILSLGKAVIRVERTHTNTWRVLLSGDGPPRILGDGLDQSYAFGVAETEGRKIAKDTGADALIQPGARWRRDPATEQQIKKLKAMGASFDVATLTKGRASDLITAAKYR
mgnify:CR=1 FL=1